MAHHNKGKSKRKGSSCKMCKPHKANGSKGSEQHQTMQERRARADERLQKRAVNER